MGGVAAYGASVSQFGSLGLSVGWAPIRSTAIMAGSLMGPITGEWQDAGVQFGVRLAGLFAGWHLFPRPHSFDRWLRFQALRILDILEVCETH